MDSLARDLRFALRFLRQRPLFTVVATLSIAVGIGATTTIFSVMNALLLRAPGGVVEPERVVEVGRTMGGRGMDTFSYPELLDMREQVTPLQHVAGWRLTPLSFNLGAEGERVMGMLVSHNYFDVMGLAAARGRVFGADEDAVPLASPVAVVSHRFWQERLGGDADVVGRTIGLNRREFTVIGVAPPDFKGHVVAVVPDVYLPLMMMGAAIPGFDAFEERFSSSLMVVARLAPGATLSQANAALTATFDRLRAVEPARYEERSARAMILGAVPGGMRGPATAFLSMVLALTGIILLITCANVAGMLLARAVARDREIAIRLALGAGRGRLVRQLVVESVALFISGGSAGVLLAVWAGSALSSVSLPVPIPLDIGLAPDRLVLGSGLALALGTGLIFGLAPALQATRPGLVAALKNESARRASSAGRMRTAFVMSQVGLSLLLLLAAGLFLRSLQRAADIDTGFDAAGVRMMSFDLSLDGYDEPRGSRFITAALTAVRALPGVNAASVAIDLPMDLGSHGSPVFPEGFVPSGEYRGLGSSFNVVSDGYIETLRLTVLRGRGFTEADAAGTQGVAVVSRTLAERAWPNQDPIGKRLRFSTDDAPLRTVVGMVEDVKNQFLMEEPEPMVYLPHAQSYRAGVTLLVQSASPAVATGDAIRSAIRSIDSNLSLTPVQSAEEYTSMGLLPQRIAAIITTSLGLLALLLSALGVYGVIAYIVTQQRREIGIRMALGARRGDVMRLVLRRGLSLAAPGIIFGVLAGFALAKLIRSFILGVAPADPAAFVAGSLVLLAAVILATLIPARRASALDPAAVLRID